MVFRKNGVLLVYNGVQNGVLFWKMAYFLTKWRIGYQMIVTAIIIREYSMENKKFLIKKYFSSLRNGCVTRAVRFSNDNGVYLFTK